MVRFAHYARASLRSIDLGQADSCIAVVRLPHLPGLSVRWYRMPQGQCQQ